jgi:hypothetical protein
MPSRAPTRAANRSGACSEGGDAPRLSAKALESEPVQSGGGQSMSAPGGASLESEGVS